MPCLIRTHETYAFSVIFSFILIFLFHFLPPSSLGFEGGTPVFATSITGSKIMRIDVTGDSELIFRAILD